MKENEIIGRINELNTERVGYNWAFLAMKGEGMRRQDFIRLRPAERAKTTSGTIGTIDRIIQ